jgi:hypothetical protein
MESIEQGREQSTVSRRALVTLASSLAVVLALGALAYVVDARWRASATDDLVIAFDETVTAIESGERQVNSVLEYTAPGDTESAHQEIVRAAAIDAASKISVARDRVDAIAILPWHGDLLTAREEADIWLALRATGIMSLAERGQAIYPPQGELDDARAALVGAFSELP